jgi:hypothetical protein
MGDDEDEIAEAPPSESADDRSHAIAAFWRDVRVVLVDHHEHSKDQADLGVLRYRLEVERPEVGDAVYNHGAERAAQVIDANIRSPDGRRNSRDTQ